MCDGPEDPAWFPDTMGKTLVPSPGPYRKGTCRNALEFCILGARPGHQWAPPSCPCHPPPPNLPRLHSSHPLHQIKKTDVSSCHGHARQTLGLSSQSLIPQNSIGKSERSHDAPLQLLCVFSFTPRGQPTLTLTSVKELLSAREVSTHPQAGFLLVSFNSWAS